MYRFIFCKSMRFPSRRFIINILAISFFALVIYLTCLSHGIIIMGTQQNNLTTSSNMSPLPENRGFVLNTPGCQIPDWDPFDPTVIKFFEQVSPYKCPGNPPFLISNPNAAISVDYNILKSYYNEEDKDISCTYRPILRKYDPQDERSDNMYCFGEYKKLLFDVPLKDEFISINCSLKNKLVFLKYDSKYSLFLPLIPLKDKVERTKSEKSKILSKKDHLNVIILGIDSVSKLNFLRHFKKTYNFLYENLRYYELKGYTKVGDNTFPNLIPLFTGHFMEEYWNGSVRNIFFDDVPFIWKNYSERGYRTYFAEDAPNIGTFHFMKRGFRNPPTDYYFRPFTLAVEKFITTPNNKAQCLHSQLEIDILFNYLRDFVKTMKNRPFFAYTFATRLTHDSLNKAGYADDSTYRLLKDFNSYGILNTTLLIFLSDHGIRFSQIRQTYIGKFEERMPFIFLFFPPWFLNKYPKFENNLHSNQNRLTTPFDIHATLVHLLQLKRQPKDARLRFTPHGISLMDPIPESRTCETASILPHWCTCQTHRPVPVTDPIVFNCAVALVDTLNKILNPFVDECAALSLRDIIDARYGQVSDVVLRFTEQKNRLINRPLVFGKKINAPVDYLIIIKVNPSEGVFEATVRYDEKQGTYKVLNDISRINRYGNQSICMTDAIMRKFCYCLKQDSL